MKLSWLLLPVLACAAPLATSPNGGCQSDYSRCSAAAAAAKRSGNLRLALALYGRSLELPIFEVPNYENLLQVVALHCELGDEESALSVAEELRCAIDVDLGRERCYLDDAKLELNPRVRSCGDRMCGELYLVYYDFPSEEQLRLAKELEATLLATLARCRPE
jgi:hypothetical protein